MYMNTLATDPHTHKQTHRDLLFSKIQTGRLKCSICRHKQWLSITVVREQEEETDRGQD